MNVAALDLSSVPGAGGPAGGTMKNLTSSTVAAISKGGKVVVLLLRDDQLHRRSGSVGPVGVRLRQPKKSGVDDFMFVAALEVGRPFLFCRKRHLRVSVLASALPSGGNTPPDAFIGGGRALQGAPPLARCALAVAWLINLCVLLGGHLFVVLSVLSVAEERARAARSADAVGADAGATLSAWGEAAGQEYVGRLVRAYGISVALSWCVKDVLVPVVIALLPLDSRKGRWVAGITLAALGLLAP